MPIRQACDAIESRDMIACGFSQSHWFNTSSSSFCSISQARREWEERGKFSRPRDVWGPRRRSKILKRVFPASFFLTSNMHKIRICQRGTMASARSASLNGGLGAEPPAGSRGRAPGGGSGGRSPPEAESFVYIFMQKSGQKIKDLSKNLPPCLSRRLSRAAMTSPNFWSMGGAAAPTAHSWIRHCIKSIFGLGSDPDPAGRAYGAPPDP